MPDDTRAACARALTYDAARARTMIRRFATDAMAFVAVESGMLHWFDNNPPNGTGALVACVDTGSEWVAACGPVVEPEYAAHVATDFVRAAHRAGRRACFFGAETLAGNDFERLAIGAQPLFRPSAWLQELSKRRRLREQLRRARAKGVCVRRVHPKELEEGQPFRRRVETLAREWLSSKHMAPMAFVVALEPFHFPEDHRYYAAEREGALVGLLSAVPIGSGRSWLIEDVIRSRHAPNGTTELLFHALLREAGDSDYVTFGLTPLAGNVAWPLRAIRQVSRPLFDFDGLTAFRRRMQPSGWIVNWLVYPAGESPALHLIQTLRAFAGGSLTRFALRTLMLHPSGLPWLLALPLVPWIPTLGYLLLSGQASLLGFPPAELGLWMAFDALMFAVLLRAAMRPSVATLSFATALALGDAVLSAVHLGSTGIGISPGQELLRGLATIAPLAGAPTLAWTVLRARKASLA